MGTPRRDLATEPWQPSFPAQAAGDGALYQPRADSTEDAPRPGKPYEPAPPTSHLHGWRTFTDSFSRKFVAESYGFARGNCLLEVVFRAKGKSAQTQYYFAFPTPEACERWADVLRGAARPGEHIPDVQAACLAYKRVR